MKITKPRLIIHGESIDNLKVMYVGPQDGEVIRSFKMERSDGTIEDLPDEVSYAAEILTAAAKAVTEALCDRLKAGMGEDEVAIELDKPAVMRKLLDYAYGMSFSPVVREPEPDEFTQFLNAKKKS